VNTAELDFWLRWLKSGAPEISGAAVWIGGPCRSRTYDPLIKSPDLHKRTEVEAHERTGTYEPTRPRQRRLSSDESGCVGTNLEPESGAPVPSLSPRDTQSASPSRRIQRRTTYREIRAYIFAHHGFTPRTGWIAHVKELNGLTLRPTHNRHAATRADPCPPERRTAIEEALRHFHTP
jgi:hypothetical protein